MESFWLPMPSLVDSGGEWPGWGSNQLYPGEEWLGWRNHGEPSSGLESTDMEIVWGAVECSKSNQEEEQLEEAL